MESDPSKMLSAAKAFIEALRLNQASTTHFLISCGKHKQLVRAPAAKLYTSPRFQLSVALPSRLGFSFSLLSAKHGLLEPNELVDPYDSSLATLTRDERRIWAERVLTQLLNAHKDVRRFVLLLDDDYRDDLAPLLIQRKFELIEPLSNFERSGRISFIRHSNRYLDRESAVAAVYNSFEGLPIGDRLPTLRETLIGSLPSQGVYFFFDHKERTRFAVKIPRLVRVGTHAVSSGSKATLRDRLRTHFGTAGHHP
jgi:hypothetical protein